MFVAQVVGSFLAWIGFGWWLSKLTARRRPSIAGIKRGVRVALGPVLMLAGAAALLGGFKMVAAVNGLVSSEMTPLGWAILTLIGFVFVGAQVIATTLIVSLAIETEPSGTPKTSDRRINE